MSSTVHVAESVSIASTPERVWTAIADYSFDLRWRKGLREMQRDPPGGPAVGTKVHEVVRRLGRDFVADTTVTELEPNASYRFAGQGTIGDVAGGRSVRAAAGGEAAVFTYEIRLTPTGGMRLLRPVLGAMVRSGLRRDLQRLKGLLEGGA